MTFANPHRLCLLLLAGLLTACAIPAEDRANSICLKPSSAPSVPDRRIDWSAYPIMAHKLNGEEAPIVRWIDTDGDGVSNYRLLCTFENGRVRVNKAIRDKTFMQKYKKASG